MKGWKKLFYADGSTEKAGAAIFTSNKIDFQAACDKRQRRALRNDKGVNPARGSSIRKYAPSMGTPKCIKPILTKLKGETATQ